MRVFAVGGAGNPQERMDQTQLLEWDGEADSEDTPGGAGQTPRPVGRLHLLSSKYGPEKDFWIYPGKNVIGRLESCQICLPVASVSKAHAVIEVPSLDGPHLLYDQGSLNRTRHQRVVLIPQVRYSLQDGDALLFGDVGCQYFMLAPEGDSKSPDDSMEVPPTQAKVEASTLLIEETPVPGRRRLGFGGVLVQDSDEEKEELVNEAGRILHPSGTDGSDSSIKDATRGDSKSAASKFLSPSATVVPESDEESDGEPSGHSAPGPSLCLTFENDVAERLENGAVTPSNQDRHPAQPKRVATEPKATPDCGEPAAKEQGTPTDPSLVDFHLDSDTDVEDEKEMDNASKMPGSGNLARDGLSLEVGSDTGSEEPVVANPDDGSKKDHQAVIDIGSDTDVEEVVESSGVSGLKPHQPAQNKDDGTDVEGAVEDLGMASPESCWMDPPNEGSDKGVEEMGGDPKGHQPDEKRDSNTGAEEAVSNPELHLQTQQPTENEDSDTDVEEASLKVESTQEAHRDAGDSSDDTDVEVADAEPKAPAGDGPHSSSPISYRDRSLNDEEISTKGVVLQGDNNLASGSRAQEMKKLSTEVQRSQGVSSEQSSSLDMKEPLENPGMVENPVSLPLNQYLPVLSVDSDTDVEQASESPDMKESHGDAANGPRERDAENSLEDPDAVPQKSSGPVQDRGSDTDVEVISPNHGSGEDRGSDADVEVVSPTHRPFGPGGNGGSDTDVEVVSPNHNSPGPGEDRGSDTDVEVISPTHTPSGPGGDGGSDSDVQVISSTHKPPVTQDSDTVVEEAITSLPEKTIEEQDTQLVPVESWVDREKSASSAAEHEPYEEEDDMDTDGHAGDESSTSDDPDLVFQPTQCYLPADACSPKPGKASEITGLGCSSPLKDGDSDSDAYMLEATQAFCKEPEQLLEEPTQAFIAGEETEFFQHPPEGDKHSEQPTQDAFPVLASRVQQTDCFSESSTQPYSLGLPCSSVSVSQPAGSTAAEKNKEKEEIKPLGSVPVSSADGKHPLVLQEADEVNRSQEQPCVAASHAESSVEHSQTQRSAGHVDSESKERSSAPAGTRNAEQLPECSTEGASKPVASAPARRRSLRSSSAAVSPAPVPESRSCRRGHIEAANTDVTCKPVTRLTRCKGLRQLGNPTQYMGEPEKKTVQPEREDVSPNKKPRNGELTVITCQNRAWGLRRKSGADSESKEETEVAVDSPGTRGPTRRGQRRTAAELVEKQPELPRTRASRRSSSSSATTLSPKVSGEPAKPRQETAVPTLSSRRRSQRLSTESKPVETRTQPRNRSKGSSPSSTPAPKVLFTGVIDEEGEHVVTELGGSLAESVFDCTHLVTDRVRRTVKFLCALARGIPIVTLNWLEKSKRNSCFLAPNNFLVCDPEQEKNFQFSLTESLQRVRQTGGLLQGYEIHVTPNVKPEPEHMRDIVKCSGGTFLSRMPRAYKVKRIVISCPEDLPRCRAAHVAGLPITNSEFILTGVLQQKVDLDMHRLDMPSPSSPAASATRTSKRRAAVPTAPAPPSTAKRRR